LQTTYTSGGKPIAADVFYPNRSGRYPIVLALHGSGGFHAGYGTFPQMLADRGFYVILPRYFESTGTGWAHPTIIRQHFPEWMTTISDGIDYATQQPQADSDRIGIVGFSLGAYLGLSLGSQQPRVRALVDFFGGLPDHFVERIQHLPPVLILHGERDNVVPVTEAHKVENLYRTRGADYEMKLFRNAGHGFSGFDMLDAGQRTYFFLKKHLG
jgi:carboxymethylenebutenolidase